MPVAKAKRDPRVQPLLDAVQSHYKISFERSKTPNWGAKVVGRTAHIYYQNTAHPGGSLAHELLHVLLHHRGYRRLLFGSSKFDQASFMRLWYCLDNELQHHRMYPEFASHGFAANEFYADDDCETAEDLNEALTSNPGDILDILPEYFTLIAPGGCLSPTERESFEARFMTLDNGRFAAVFSTVRLAIEDWARATSLNAESTLRRIFLAIQNPCYTWFGYSESDHPPEGGFFIDQPFPV